MFSATKIAVRTIGRSQIAILLSTRSKSEINGRLASEQVRSTTRSSRSRQMNMDWQQEVNSSSGERELRVPMISSTSLLAAILCQCLMTAVKQLMDQVDWMTRTAAQAVFKKAVANKTRQESNN